MFLKLEYVSSKAVIEHTTGPHPSAQCGEGPKICISFKHLDDSDNADSRPHFEENLYFSDYID